MKAIVVIPVHVGSACLVHKALRDFADVPMVGQVYRGVAAPELLEDVIIATDSAEITDVRQKNGGMH